MHTVTLTLTGRCCTAKLSTSSAKQRPLHRHIPLPRVQ